MKRLTASVLTMLLSTLPALGQYEITWYTLDGGGGMASTGGAYSLAGTIGQPDAGLATGAMIGGSFALVGGFWTVAPAVCPCPGNLNGDNLKNGADIQLFTACVVSGAPCPCADVDGIPGVTLNDASVFANDLVAGASCP